MKIYFPLLLLVFIGFSSCGKIEEPVFRRVEGFGVKKIGLQETVIGFSATYYNPNNFGVTVKEAALEVYIDSVYLGKFIQPQSTGVQKRAEFSIPLEGAITFQKAMQFNIPSLIGKEVLIKADGSVRVGKAGVFVTKEIKYLGKHRLDADLLKNPAGAGLQN